MTLVPAFSMRFVRFHLLILSILLGVVFALMLSLPGCAAQPSAPTPPPFRVPSASNTQSNTFGPLAVYPLEDADYGRGEKIAQGPAEISAIEVFSELTYDPQRIGPRRDGGYRTRYTWHQTFTLP